MYRPRFWYFQHTFLHFKLFVTGLRQEEVTLVCLLLLLFSTLESLGSFGLWVWFPGPDNQGWWVGPSLLPVSPRLPMVGEAGGGLYSTNPSPGR